MSIETPTSDADLMDLLRIAGPLRVTELSDAMEVTATAVRQRLTRLLAQGLIQREAVREGRGRPRHRYWLTEKGLRETGSNFTDLALALWKEVDSIADGDQKRHMLRRIARALALGYADQVRGETPTERMHSLAELLTQRRIPVSVEEMGSAPVLTTHACPYPKLAESDSSVCAMEQILFSELLGQEVHLTRCRLHGAADCQFQAR